MKDGSPAIQQSSNHGSDDMGLAGFQICCGPATIVFLTFFFYFLTEVSVVVILCLSTVAYWVAKER